MAWVTACGAGHVVVVEPGVVVIERERERGVEVDVDVEVDLGVAGEIDVDGDRGREDHRREAVRDVVFILDASGSMRRAPVQRREPPVGIGAAPRPGIDLEVSEWFPSSEFARAQKELVLALRGVPDGVRVGVVSFGEGVATYRGSLVVLDGGERGAIEQFVLRQVPFGGSTLSAGLAAAYDLDPARIVIVSDGLISEAAGSRGVLLSARAAIARGVRFDSISTGARANTGLLAQLASESGGVAATLP